MAATNPISEMSIKIEAVQQELRNIIRPAKKRQYKETLSKAEKHAPIEYS